MASDERTLFRLTQHFTQKGLILFGFWLARRQVQRFTKKKPGKGSSAPAGYHLLRAKDFQPLNPLWVIEAAEWATSGVPQEHRPQDCPALVAFKEEVRERGLVVQPGHAARDALFALDPEVAFLNHGSYGASFRLASEVQAWYRELLEREPVYYFECVQRAAIALAKAELAHFVGAQPRDVVAVTNATSAASAVIASVSLGPGDFLLCTLMTYPAVANVVARTAEQAGARLLVVDLDAYTLLAGAEAVTARFQAALRGAPRGRVKLAVLDHIGSSPPVEFVLPPIISVCRAAGAKVLVDGAHAVGAIPLNVPALSCHFYLSNCHKWLCTPKSAAFLWAAPEEQAALVPRVTSHGFRRGFQAEFAWSGTTDETAWLAVPAALAVIRALGPGRQATHSRALLEEAVPLLLDAFGTTVTLGCGTMALVELPVLPELPASAQSAAQLHELLRSRYKVEVPITYWDARLWVRVSAQLYNQLSDYQRLADAVAELRGPVLADGAASGVPNGTPPALDQM